MKRKLSRPPRRRAPAPCRGAASMWALEPSTRQSSVMRGAARIMKVRPAARGRRDRARSRSSPTAGRAARPLAPAPVRRCSCATPASRTRRHVRQSGASTAPACRSSAAGGRAAGKARGTVHRPPRSTWPAAATPRRARRPTRPAQAVEVEGHRSGSSNNVSRFVAAHGIVHGVAPGPPPSARRAERLRTGSAGCPPALPSRTAERTEHPP